MPKFNIFYCFTAQKRRTCKLRVRLDCRILLAVFRICKRIQSVVLWVRKCTCAYDRLYPLC